MFKAQKGYIFHDWSYTSAVPPWENYRKVGSQVACGSCFQTMHTSQQQMKTIFSEETEAAI